MSAPESGYREPQEPDRIPGRSSALWIAGTFMAVMVAAVLSWGFLQILGDPAQGTTADPVTSPGGMPATPYRTTTYANRPDSATRARLDRYGWIDREEGVATVPIEKAMEILVASQEGGGEP